MATFHLNQSQVFPAGTTVGAYLRTAWPRPSSSVGPSGSAVATAVVADDTVGDATFSGLAYATRYYAAAQVSGSWRWVAFQTAAVNDPDVLQGEIDDLSVLVARKAAVGFDVHDYGAVGDGATDDTTAIQAAITAAQASGGGRVLLRGLVYRVNGQLTFTHDASVPPKQAPVTLLGAGGASNGQGTDPYKGTILDMRYNGAGVAKIDTRGLDGILEMSGITFRDEGNTSKPFIQTTNTPLNIHECAFFGYSGTGTTSCTQDAIILGGTSTTLDGSSNAAFQGYITTIRNCYFNKIRRAVYGRTFSNTTIVRDNLIGHQCGSNLTNGAAIELDGGGVEYTTGWMIEGNSIEMVGYPVGIKMEHATGNYLLNSFFDQTPGTIVAYVYCDVHAVGNMIVSGYHSDSYPFVSDNSPAPGSGGGNTILNSHQSQTSLFPEYVVGRKFTTLRDGQFVANTHTAGAYGVEFQQDEVVKAGIQNYGKYWVADGAGGTMRVDTGSGGSAYEVKAYYLKLIDYANAAITAFIKVGTGSPEGALNGTVGSLFLRTDGGAGTCLYVKESGTGNTGWVAK